MIRVYFTEIVAFVQQGEPIQAMFVDCSYTQKLNDYQTIVYTSVQDFFKIETKQIARTTPL